MWRYFSFYFARRNRETKKEHNICGDRWIPSSLGLLPRNFEASSSLLKVRDYSWRIEVELNIVLQLFDPFSASHICGPLYSIYINVVMPSTILFWMPSTSGSFFFHVGVPLFMTARARFIHLCYSKLGHLQVAVGSTWPFRLTSSLFGLGWGVKFDKTGILKRLLRLG